MASAVIAAAQQCNRFDEHLRKTVRDVRRGILTESEAVSSILLEAAKLLDAAVAEDRVLQAR